MTTLLRLPEVARRTGYSEHEVVKRTKEGRFPKSVPIGGRAVAWVEEEVEQYIVGLIALRDERERQKA